MGYFVHQGEYFNIHLQGIILVVTALYQLLYVYVAWLVDM